MTDRPHGPIVERRAQNHHIAGITLSAIYLAHIAWDGSQKPSCFCKGICADWEPYLRPSLGNQESEA